MNLKVVCVKWGKKFPSLYVNKLYNMVKRHLTIPHNFVCLTDDPKDLNPKIEIIELKNKFEYCWTKIELFKPDNFSNQDVCLFLDLDIVITDNINDLVKTQLGKEFIGLFNWGSTRKNPLYNSSVMLFYGNCHINLYNLLISKLNAGTLKWEREYDAYLDSNDKVVLWEGSQRYGSDQEWISQYVYPKKELKRNSFPKKWIRSYKRHGTKRLPRNCKIMVFHGFPKPHEVDHDYVNKHWQ